MTCDRSVVFSGYSRFSNNKIDRHDITEVLLKVALNTIALTHPNPENSHHHKPNQTKPNLQAEYNYFVINTSSAFTVNKPSIGIITIQNR
jgi:phosphoribosyl 1,2-cyclic phosphodiesterase